MIYIIAVILGLANCVQGFLSEITEGNITHLKNGRLPNAGAAMFPSIPFVPLIYVGAAWVLRKFVPEYAMWILFGAFFALSFLWFFSFAKVRVELRRIEAAQYTNDPAT